MNKNMKILLCTYFGFSTLYAILKLVSDVMLLAYQSFTASFFVDIVLLLVSITGIVYIFKKPSEIVQFVSLPIFTIYLAMLASNIISLIAVYNVLSLALLISEAIAIVALLLSIVLTKKIGIFIPCIVGIVSTAFLFILVSIAFFGLLILSVDPLTMIIYMACYATVVLALVSFISLLVKRKDITVLLSSNQVVIEEPKENERINSSGDEKTAVEMLKELKSLYDSGVITQEEYEEKRKQYIDKL